MTSRPMTSPHPMTSPLTSPIWAITLAAFVTPAVAAAQQDPSVPEEEVPVEQAGEETAPEGEPQLDSPAWPAPAQQPAPPPAEGTPETGASNETLAATTVVASDATDGADRDDEDGRWELTPHGYVRAGYEWVEDDPRFDFIGDNGGFVLGNARIGLRGERADYGVSFDVSVEGAAGVSGMLNTPEGELGLALRDAFLRWDFVEYVGIAVGQMKVPFMGEMLRSTASLPFVSRAVGQEGVPVGRGFETEGIDINRGLGLSIGSPQPIALGDLIGIGYEAMVFNGNGINELLDDNGRPAVAGRLELHVDEWVEVGGAVLFNSRTEGPLPDRFDEEDLGFAADIEVDVLGLGFFTQFALITTSFPTTAAEDRTRMAFHAEITYELPFVPFPVRPGYRFAYYDPWQSGGSDGGTDLSTFELMYHTASVRVDHPDPSLGLTAWINYTFTVENEARSIDNGRLQIAAQLEF